MKETTFEGTGGFNIYTRSWRPEEASPRAVVVIVHGFNSHSGYYAWTAQKLAENGLATYALDLRGRGLSDGERFYIDEFENYVRDVATLVETAKSENEDVPVFVLGHSAGGLIACLYALGHQSEIAGLISESFAFQLPAPDFALTVLKGLSHIVPHAHVLKLKNADFSRDPGVVEAMNTDPLLANEVQPTQTVAELVRADERLKFEIPNIKLPLLILHGTADKAARPSGSEFFFESAGSVDKTLKLYDGHFHDLLNDLEKEVVFADILYWLNERISARHDTTAAGVGS